MKQKMRIQNLRGVIEVQLQKNSTPSPWKRRKTSSSAVFCINVLVIVDKLRQKK